MQCKWLDEMCNLHSVMLKTSKLNMHKLDIKQIQVCGYADFHEITFWGKFK